MNTWGVPFLVLSVIVLSYANTLQGTIDINKLQSILQEGLKSKDISTLYHSIKGLKSLNAKIPDVCETIKNYKYDLNNIEEIFYLTNAAQLSGCANYLKPDVMSAATKVLDNKGASIVELYHAVYTLKALGKGQAMDKDEALKNLIQLLKKDDSAANYGYVFALCEHLGCEQWTVSHAESVLLSADESEGRALHFEGGLPATSLLLTSIIRSFKAVKQPPPLSEDQRLKFSQYLVSRRALSTPRGSTLLLEAALALSDELPPISIAIKGRKYVTTELDTIEISITDLLGRAIKSLKPEEVIAQSGTRLADDVVVLSKQPLTQKPGDPTTFVLNLSKIKAQYGLYKIALSAAGKTMNVNVAVLGEIQVSNVEVGIGDVDGTTSPKVTTVTYPNKLTDKLQADHLQKVSLKFTVRDKYNKAVLVQQAFVRVGADAHSRDETIFVAEPDNAKAYKVELNVGSLSKHLPAGSGAYLLTIYLGDSAVSNPIAWPIGHIHFNFGRAEAVVDASRTNGPLSRGPLPEIQHSFRAAEARPAKLVSDVFAALCAAPLLLLLALWARLRVNLALFPFSLSALVFHLALGASLALYGVLWLQLSMFETVRYLLPLALVTFISGHRLLRSLVAAKTAK